MKIWGDNLDCLPYLLGYAALIPLQGNADFVFPSTLPAAKDSEVFDACHSCIIDVLI
jgi:hypothetical protein